MNRLYKDLEELLKQKIKFYENFIDLLQKEWICVTKYSYESLQEIIAEKENQVMKMQALENSRSGLMKKIAGKLQVPQSSLTLKNIIQIKGNPYKDGLAKCRKTLLVQIKTISELIDKNKDLINHSALSLKKSVAYIHSADEKAVSPYTARGEMLEGRVEGRMVSVDV